jgi:lipoprotein-anchoring transpeptidase ErfK/SrfK
VLLSTGHGQVTAVTAHESGCLVKAIFWSMIALLALGPTIEAAAQQTRVVINLSEQRAYLMEGGRVSLVAPIASGKPGWSTPTGHFSIFSKDIDHRSRSFGSVFDAFGRVVNSNATPASRVPAGGHYRPAPMPYFMEFSPAVGMHAGYLPGYPASHGCVRMPRDLAARFFGRVRVGTPVTVLGNAHVLTRVRKALPAFL